MSYIITGSIQPDISSSAEVPGPNDDGTVYPILGRDAYQYLFNNDVTLKTTQQFLASDVNALNSLKIWAILRPSGTSAAPGTNKFSLSIGSQESGAGFSIVSGTDLKFPSTGVYMISANVPMLSNSTTSDHVIGIQYRIDTDVIATTQAVRAGTDVGESAHPSLGTTIVNITNTTTQTLHCYAKDFAVSYTGTTAADDSIYVYKFV